MIFQGIETTKELGYGFRGEDPDKIMVFNMPSSGAEITLAREYMGGQISDRYQIAHSAYAIVPENGNLYLYYDYRPWIGQTYQNGKNLFWLKILLYLGLEVLVQVVWI